MLAARAARTSMRVPFLRHVAPAISHVNVSGRAASVRSVGAAVHNASVRMMSSASGTTSTVRAATSNYRRRRAIPPPPPGRPPYPRPSPTMVGLWVGGAAVATFASYKIFDMFADTPASDQAQEATKFTGTLQPQAGPVNGYTKCGAAVVVTLPATNADLPSAARKLVETQEKIAAETEQLAAHVTIGFSPAAWAELSPHEAKVRHLVGGLQGLPCAHVRDDTHLLAGLRRLCFDSTQWPTRWPACHWRRHLAACSGRQRCRGGRGRGAAHKPAAGGCHCQHDVR